MTIVSSFKLYFRSSHHLHCMFIPFTGKMNSTNSPNVWAFIAQLVEHYGANAEAMGSDLVEVSVIRIWTSRAFTASLNLFSSCQHQNTFLRWSLSAERKHSEPKERLLDVQSGHQESFSARMKNRMISSFYQPLFGKNQPTSISTLGGAGRVWFVLLVPAKRLRSRDRYQGFKQ